MEKSLSNVDINNALGGLTKVIRYADLKKFKTIEDLLKKFGNAVILYPSESDANGHWTCVFYGISEKGQKILEFFDPYGFSIDKEFDLTEHKRPHYLAKLLYKSNYPVAYNNHRFQKMKPNVNTCGRHVINRILYSHLTLKQYNKLFYNGNGVDSDELVTLLVK